jgi:hypothetical protein
MSVLPSGYNGFPGKDPEGSVEFKGSGSFDIDGISNEPYEFWVEERR